MRVCVIGAGPCGLVAAKELLAEGHNVVIFEAADQIGGAFSFRNPLATSSSNNPAGPLDGAMTTDASSDPTRVAGPSRQYDSLILTISNYYMSYSDFPPPAGDGYRYWTGEEYLHYLHAYAKHFRLLEYLRLRTRVVGVRRAKLQADENAAALVKYEVEYQRSDIPCSSTTEKFDGVIVATSSTPPSRAKLDAQFPGLHQFRGTVLHSSCFWNADGLRDKKVLIVGIGETGADVARLVSKVTPHCTLLVRKYPYSIRRLNRCGVPGDAHTSRMFFPFASDSIAPWVMTILYLGWWKAKETVKRLLGRPPSRWWNMYPTEAEDPEGYVVPPAASSKRRGGEEGGGEPSVEVDGMGQYPRGHYYDYETKREGSGISTLISSWHEAEDSSHLTKFSTKNVSYMPYVVSGRLKVVRGKLSEVDATSAWIQPMDLAEPHRFTPLPLQPLERVVEPDCIIFCTGYEAIFPFMKDKDCLPVNNDFAYCFKHAFVPAIGPSLMYLGFVRPTTGGVPMCAELLARYYALLASRKRQWPSASKIEKEIATDLAHRRSFYHSNDSPFCLVNPMQYTDSVAKLIGCYCSPLRFVFSPTLFLHWQTCIDLPCKYRLVGPGATPDLAKAWILRSLTGDTIGECLTLSIRKIIVLSGLWGTGDPVRDARSLGFDLTSRVHRTRRLKQRLFLIGNMGAVVLTAMVWGFLGSRCVQGLLRFTVIL